MRFLPGHNLQAVRDNRIRVKKVFGGRYVKLLLQTAKESVEMPGEPSNSHGGNN